MCSFIDGMIQILQLRSLFLRHFHPVRILRDLRFNTPWSIRSHRSRSDDSFIPKKEKWQPQMGKWFWEKDTTSSFGLGSKPPPRRYVWHFLYWAPGDDIRIVEKTMIFLKVVMICHWDGRWWWCAFVESNCQTSLEVPLKSDMTAENPPWMKMYILLEMGVLECHISFPGCMWFFFCGAWDDFSGSSTLR